MKKIPSLRGLLIDSRKRIVMALKGDKITDKILLFFWAVLDSTPHTLLHLLPFIKHPINNIKNLMVKRTIINLNENKFYCIDSESILILSYDFEKWMWNHLKLGGGNVFLDVGAHIGKYTIPAAKIVGVNGFVVAVEPNPENCKILLKNVQLNKLRNVEVVNIAAWNRKEILKLFIAEDSGQHSIKRNFGFGFVTVPALPLDHLLNELDLDRIDYIKIDVEGAEFEVLEGLKETLRTKRPIIIVEVKKCIDKLKEMFKKENYGVEFLAPEYYMFKPLEKN
ncbi:MAG: FkbM family methyltransferase [Candidatus Bathyarchaeia archaeon]